MPVNLVGPVSGTRRLVSETPAAVRVRYVAVSGSDANDGTAWASAKRTIQAAVNDLNGAGTVHVGAGAYLETVTLADPDLRIIGAASGIAGAGGSSYIVAPSGSASALVVTASRCSVENIGLQGGTASYTGTVVDAEQTASPFSMTNVLIDGGDSTPTASSGGVGLALHTEGGTFDRVSVRHCAQGVKFFRGATENVFTQLRGDTNWQDLVWDDAVDNDSGGNVFLHAKFVYTQCPPEDGYFVDIGPAVGGGGNVFVKPDWGESPIVGAIRVSSSMNSFDMMSLAQPMLVTGDRNVFRQPRFFSDVTIDGDDNELWQPNVVYNTTVVTINGDGCVVHKPHLEAGATISYGTAEVVSTEPS